MSHFRQNCALSYVSGRWQTYCRRVEALRKTVRVLHVAVASPLYEMFACCRSLNFDFADCFERPDSTSNSTVETSATASSITTTRTAKMTRMTAALSSIMTTLLTSHSKNRRGTSSTFTSFSSSLSDEAVEKFQWTVASSKCWIQDPTLTIEGESAVPDFDTLKNVTTEAKCRRICQTNGECGFWAWRNRDRICHLKTVAGKICRRIEPEEGKVVGPRNCTSG